MVSWIFIALVVLVVYIIFELMMAKHGIITLVVIIFLILFLLSLVFVFKNRAVDLDSFGGIKNATSVYFDWLALTWNNFRTLTGNAAKTEWTVNSSKSKPK